MSKPCQLSSVSESRNQKNTWSLRRVRPACVDVGNALPVNQVATVHSEDAPHRNYVFKCQQYVDGFTRRAGADGPLDRYVVFHGIHHKILRIQMHIDKQRSLLLRQREGLPGLPDEPGSPKSVEVDVRRFAVAH